MKRLLKILFAVLALISLLIALAIARNWIGSYRPNPNGPAEFGQMVPINDYSHWLKTSKGWITYLVLDKAGERVVWKIPLVGLFAVFLVLPTLWILGVVRGVVRRRSRGFEVITGESGQTDQLKSDSNMSIPYPRNEELL